MDLHCYKWPQPVEAGGFLVHPIPQSDFEKAAQETNAWAKRHRVATWAARLELCLRLAARAARVRTSRLRGLSVDQAIALVRAWARVQAASLPDPARLEAILRLGVVDDPLVQSEGALAYHAPTAAEFYGLPLNELTAGQLSYYWTLRACFREMHVDDDGKRYSRKWLQRKAQEAQLD